MSTCWIFNLWLTPKFIWLSLHSYGRYCRWILWLITTLGYIRLLLNQVLRYLLGRLIVILLIYPVIEIPDIKSQVIIIYELYIVDLFVNVLEASLHLCTHLWSVIRAHGVRIVVHGAVCIIRVATLRLSSIVDDLEIVHTHLFSFVVDIILIKCQSHWFYIII